MNKKITCPICKKSTHIDSTNSFRPFCSERCQLIDLGKWSDESYNISEPIIPNNDLDYPDTH